jgi:glycosyltransferase involved in cell wall biosynthesis
MRAWAKRAKYLTLAILSSRAEQRLSASSRLAEHDFRQFFAKRYLAHLHPPVSDEELIALYSRSQISLGFLEVYADHDPSKVVLRHLHLREFEAPLCGALYLTGSSAELEEFFVPGEEVLTYSNPDELVEKARFYLAHPEAGEKIRAAGRKRALAEHTYQRRYEQLFEALSLG